jgi:hypothetical protein
MKRKKRSLIGVLDAVLLVLCIVTLSISLIPNLSARFTSATVSENTARVAKFAIDENFTSESQSVQVTALPGGQDTVQVEISNPSEVAVQCTLTVDRVTKNLPLTVHSNDAMTATLAPNGSTTITLNWAWDESAGTDDKYSGMVDYVKLTLTSEQID